MKNLPEVTLFVEEVSSGEDWTTYQFTFERVNTDVTKQFHSVGPMQSLSAMESEYLSYVASLKNTLKSGALYTEISDSVEGDYAMVMKAFDLDMTCNFILYNHIYGYQSVCCAFLLDNSSQEMLTAVDYSDMVGKIREYTGVVIPDDVIENAVVAAMKAAEVGGNYVVFLQDETTSVSVSVYNFGTAEECWRVDSLVIVDKGLTSDEWSAIEWEVNLP